MKVACFLPRLRTTGGAEILAESQVRALRERGHDVRVVALDASDAWRRRLADLPFEAGTQRAHDAVLARLLVAFDRRFVERALGDADVVVAHNHPASAILGLVDVRGRRVWYCHEPPRALHREVTCPEASRLSRRRDRLGEPLARTLIVERALHRLDRALHGPWQRLARLERRGIENVPNVLCNSAFTLHAFRASYGRSDGEVVHPMVPFAPRAHGKRVDRAAPVFLCHSRLQVEKNVGGVLRAFSRLRTRFPAATLRIVGTGADEARLRAVAKGVAGVRFSGFLPADELERAYDEADVFVSVPFDEPFGMVFPEALLRGLPVVGSDHAGPREILENGRLGELADAADPASIADAMLRALDRSPASSRAASELMVQRYGKATIANRLVSALEAAR